MPGAEEGPFAQPTSFAVATPEARNLRDLRRRRYGQPVYVSSDQILARKGQVGTWEKFNVRLAVVKFSDSTLLGYDPADLLLPTRYEEGKPVFETHVCELCRAAFALTQMEVDGKKEPTRCTDCRDV